MNNLALEKILIDITSDKHGVEIGGPSVTRDIIYKNAKDIDNVIFSPDTVWSKHGEDYMYYKDKIGKVIINDAVNISSIKDESYDFCLSSHSLEHIANPLKAVKEWLRVIKTGGYVIIIVPEKSVCFDYRRNYSKFSTLLSQYEKNVGEDDLSTLPEILNNYDYRLEMKIDEFYRISQDNYNNRRLHHYCYDDLLLMEICNYLNCEFIYKETRWIDRWFVMKKVN